RSAVHRAAAAVDRTRTRMTQTKSYMTSVAAVQAGFGAHLDLLLQVFVMKWVSSRAEEIVALRPSDCPALPAPRGPAPTHGKAVNNNNNNNNK
uniref:Uncharacterized protein n=1 Tax=Neogobius melanostomus TaxID=47308 RepID=A0A8C6SDV4_9GOBI